MTENPANTGEADGTYRSTLVAFGPQDEQADLPDELADAEDELDVPAGLAGTDDHDQGGGGGFAAGAVSGGFGFAGLALAVVSLTTNWTGGVVASHSQYGTEMNAPSSGLTAQQQLNMYANAWHTQGWWALVFAAAAVLAGAGALLWPRFRRGGGDPGWARAAATSAIIVGLVGALLAVLTIAGVFGGHLTAPVSAT
jgi:hypothetical protein